MRLSESRFTIAHAGPGSEDPPSRSIRSCSEHLPPPTQGSLPSRGSENLPPRLTHHPAVALRVDLLPEPPLSCIWKTPSESPPSRAGTCTQLAIEPTQMRLTRTAIGVLLKSEHRVQCFFKARPKNYWAEILSHGCRPDALGQVTVDCILAVCTFTECI